MKRLLGGSVVFVVGCASPIGEPPELSTAELAATVCGDGPTVKGVDVSYYQGTIDWAAAHGDGVEYAFVRVSDGTTFEDPKFQQNWDGTRAHGILHGAYQFFRPNEDALAQADLLLAKIGTPQPDDLPPVIDVEATGGLGPGDVESQVRIWVDRVTEATGKAPIIYTGFYFWRDQVGAPDLTSSPLWHAQYTSASCPNIAPPWQDWAFWQYTSSGSVAGISGNVDTNRFNGTRDQLIAMTVPPRECNVLGPEGGVLDDSGPCFDGGGPQQYLRRPHDAGESGGLVWTHTIDEPAEVNYGQWNVRLASAGTYTIEVSTPAAYAQSKRAFYLVHTATGETAVEVDQTAVDGWQNLGEFELEAGDGQFIHLGDNTGEPVTDNVQIVFDAVRITPVTPPGTDPGTDPTDPTDPDGADAGGCSSGGRGGFAALGLVLVAVCAARRRRR